MSIESRAADVLFIDDSGTLDFTDNMVEVDYEGTSSSSSFYRSLMLYTTNGFSLVSGLNDDTYYSVDCNILGSISFSTDVYMRGTGIVLGNTSIFYNLNGLGDSAGNVNIHNVNRNIQFVVKGSVLNSSYFQISSEILAYNNTAISYDIDLDFSITSCTPLSNSESSDYEAGYNAGYLDGLLDGEASIDTDAIYNEAYQAGYEAGFADGEASSESVLYEPIDIVVSGYVFADEPVVGNLYNIDDVGVCQLSAYDYLSSYNWKVGHTYEIIFDTPPDFAYDEEFISIDSHLHDVLYGYWNLYDVTTEQSWTLGKGGTSPVSINYVCNATPSWEIRTDCNCYFYADSSLNSGMGYKLFVTLPSVKVIDKTPRTTNEILEDTESKIEEGNRIAEETKDIVEETKDTTNNIFSSISDFFGSFFQNLVDSVIGLFVPSTEEMSGLFDQLNQFFSDRFGFLYAPFDYMIQLLDVFISSTGDTGLTFPGFSIMGYEVWPDMTYDISEDPLVGQIFQYVRMGTGILLAGWFVMYLQDFFKERFSQG